MLKKNQWAIWSMKGNERRATKMKPEFDCPYCGVVMPRKEKADHKCEPAKVFDHAKKTFELEDIKNGKTKETPMEQKQIMISREEKQPAIINIMESPERAVEILNSIKANFAKLLKDNNEIIQIKGKDYVRYEGWVTIATAMGIMPRVVDLVKNDGSYMAKAEAVLIKTGAVIGAGYGLCSKDEVNWKDKPEFAIASMAQTRSCGKALKTILSGVITHLGFEATPAEEMDINGNEPPIKHTVKETVNEDGSKTIEYAEEIPSGGCTEKQQHAIYAILKNKGLTDTQIKEKLAADYGVEHTRQLTKQQASEVIDLYGKK